MKPPTGTPTWRDALAFFLGEYLSRHRGLSPRTVESYATALRFLSDRIDVRTRAPHELEVSEVLRFLEDLERRRGNAPQTRNARLAALKSFWRAMMLWDHGHKERYDQLLEVPFKRHRRRLPDYLEPQELKCLFGTVDARTRQGFRDLALLRYVYNTGSRISEVAEARTSWLLLTAAPEAAIRGKGGKCRICPLWSSTAEMLRVYLRDVREEPRKGYEEFLFLTRLGTSFARQSLWKMMGGYFKRAAAGMLSLQHKRLTPHTLRRTTAVHLLRAGVEINVIKAWLGHADISTTSQYLDLDLDKKREALERFGKLDIDRMVDGAKNTAPLPANIVSWLERL